MPRKKTKSLVRDIPADRKYNDVRVARLINRVMLNGKKQLAEKISSISKAKVAVKILGSTVQQEQVDIYCPNITKANTINVNIKIQLTESILKTIKFYESY